MKVCIETRFKAAHYLKGQKKCSHIHNYGVKATIEGKVGVGGMVVDFGEVKKVLRQFDHTTLNDAKAFDSEIPTAENLVLYFVEDLIELGSFETVEVTIWETEDCSVTVKELGVRR